MKKNVIIVRSKGNDIGAIWKFLEGEGCSVLKGHTAFLGEEKIAQLIQHGNSEEDSERLLGRCNVFLVLQDDGVNTRNVLGELVNRYKAAYVSLEKDAESDEDFFFVTAGKE